MTGEDSESSGDNCSISTGHSTPATFCAQTGDVENFGFICYERFDVNESVWDLECRYARPEYITEGAYGEVAKAKEIKSGDSVVIKKMEILQGDQHADWENAVRIFKHPFICSIKDLFPSPPGGRFTHMYVVTPFFGMGSLDNYKVQSNAEAAEILAKTLSALKFMHAQGVLHRDIKRENIFIGYRNADHLSVNTANSWGSGICGGSNLPVVLGDFGLSRASRRRMTSEIVTQPYRAPCLQLGCRDYGPEIDVYALGCVLFEMVATADDSFANSRSDCLIGDELLGGDTQLIAQMAVVAFPENLKSVPCELATPFTSSSNPRRAKTDRNANDWGKLAKLAMHAKVDLNGCLQKSQTNQSNVQSHMKRWWSALLNQCVAEQDNSCTRETDTSPENQQYGQVLFDSLSELIRGMMCFVPEHRYSVADAFDSKWFQLLGFSNALTSIRNVQGVYHSPGERYDEDLETLKTLESKALDIKMNLWDLIRVSRPQLPRGLLGVYSGERLTKEQMGDAPVLDTYVLKIYNEGSSPVEGYETPQSPDELGDRKRSKS